MTHLKEHLALSESDRERERATEQRCATLEGRLTALSAQLLEAKREHTPVRVVRVGRVVRVVTLCLLV